MEKEKKRIRKIKAAMILRDGSQFGFAQRMGIHESDVSKVLHGRKKISQKEQERWASALGLSKKEIFSE